MIYFEPNPILEASNFLTNRAAGLSFAPDLRKNAENNNSSCKCFAAYAEIILELERRLGESITVPEDTVMLLFGPLFRNTKENCYPSDDQLFRLLIPCEFDAFAVWDETNFFDNLRQLTSQIPQRILYLLGISPTEHKEIDMAELFTYIKNSNLPQNTKLDLLDFAYHPGQYIDLLQETLLPVVRAFRECRELIEPLLQEYRKRYEGKNEKAVVKRLWRSTQNNADTIIMRPSVIFCIFLSAIFSNDNAKLLCCVGVLYELWIENPSPPNNSGNQLCKTLDVLGNQSRFNIVTKLLDGPAYGRELANYLGISPVAVSQHINILLSINLVTMHSEGNRTYYSLNTDSLDRFMALLKTHFRRE